MFFSIREGRLSRVFRTALVGGAEPSLVLGEDGMDLSPCAWTRDGTVVISAGKPAARHIWALTLETGEVRPVIEGEASAGNPALSPDGRWMAYDSDETGEREVYLADFPEARSRFRISIDGGSAPVSSGDGTEIDVSIEGGQPLLGQPRRLFSMDMKTHSHRQFDTLDGRRFLVNANVDAGTRTPLTVMLNWAEGLSRPPAGR